MNNYYCLVTGLPEISLDDGKLSYSVLDFKETIYPYLAKEDQRMVDLFYLQYDNRCLLALLRDKDAVVDNSNGVYTPDELLSIITAVKENDARNRKYPAYLYDFAERYMKDKEAGEAGDALAEDVLSSCYYQYAMRCGNAFVASWYEFNLNLNNLLVAITARKYKLDVARNVVGDTEVCEALRTSTARDFGLFAVLDYYDTVSRLSEVSDLLERERKIDQLKWDWMEDATFFHYFSIERVFVFLLKLSLIERWACLDKQKGNDAFRFIIASLKDEVSIPEEFRK